MTSRIYPSCDLHLFLGAPPTPLHLFTNLEGVWTDLGNLVGFSLAMAEVRPPPPAVPAQKIATLVNNAIVPGIEGEQLARLTATIDTGVVQTWDVGLRVTVHHALRELHFPIAKLTLETQRSDRVLTVYGRFANAANVLSTFDITRHTYLTYVVTSLSGAPDAVSVDASGRVTTGSSAGTARVTVSAAGISTTIDIEVIAAVTDRPILMARWTGSALRKKSIVLVSEGFTAAEQKRFDDIAFQLAERIAIGPSPYFLLRDSLDIYSAFIASPEQGITIGPPVVRIGTSPLSLVAPTVEQIEPGAGYTQVELIQRLGDPQANPITFTNASSMLNVGGRTLNSLTFAVWRAQSPPPPQSRVRETNVGLMMGERHTSTATRFVPSTQAQDVGRTMMLPTLTNRTPAFDDRRLPDLMSHDDPETAHLDMQDRFVTSLRPPDGAAGFGATWARGGNSFGLVIYIVNCDHYGGVTEAGYVGMSIGGMVLAQQQPSSIPGLIDVVTVPRPASQLWKSVGVERPISSVANSLAHELGHTSAMGSLLDEYGGNSGGVAPKTDDLAHLDKSPNLQPLAKARLPNNPAIVARRLKWNWHRIAAAADVEQIVAQGNQLVITMVAEDLMAWPENIIGRTAFLRERSTTLVGTAAQSEALTIRAVDVTAQTITVDVSPVELADVLADVFKTDAVFYMARIDASNNVLTLVDPAVITAMAHGPFEAATQNCGPPAQKGPPATIPGYQFPADHNTLLAAYEGGGGYDCAVIRPAAVCKMQHESDSATELPVDFCFVCKYVIVEAIEPRSHGELDKSEYPRAPGTRVLP